MVRNGFKGQKQVYKCKDCKRQFLSKKHRQKEKVIYDYIEGKQTITQLSQKYKVSEKTIRRDLSNMRHIKKISKDKHVVIQMDTTYWGRNNGLMVIKDAFRNKIIWHKYVRHESIKDYVEGVRWLEDHNFKIYGIVIDGIRGLAKALEPYPVQLCQFHQILLTKRYLTSNPEIEASQKLLKLVKNITKTDKESFVEFFNLWYEKYKDILNERVHDKRIKNRLPPYMRPQLRSAYLSLKRNMSLLILKQN